MEAVVNATDDVEVEVVYKLTKGDFVQQTWRCTTGKSQYRDVGFTDEDEHRMADRPLGMACICSIDLVGMMMAGADKVDPGLRWFGVNPDSRDVADEVHADLRRLVSRGVIRPPA